jgi:hypothetical protein
LLTKTLRPYCSAGEPWTIGPSDIVRKANAGWGLKESMREPAKYLMSVANRGVFSDGRSYFYHDVGEVFGAKIHTYQLDEMFRLGTDGALLSAIDCAIFLRRKNLTEQAISCELLLQKHRHINASLDVDKLQGMAENWVSQYKRWWGRVSKCASISVWYEDLDSDVIGVSNAVREFVGLPKSRIIEHGMTKLRSPEGYSKIENYDEVVRKMGEVYGVPFGSPGIRWEQ